jgi:hypothetical protein
MSWESIKWHSVKDEMPPKDTIVLFVNSKLSSSVLYGFWDNDRWYEAGQTIAILPEEITYWGYLPEPPEDEN